MIDSTQTFLSCDWGTSSFRLRLLSVPGLRILAETADDTGIAATYKLWQQRGKDEDNQRLLFYQEIIQQHILKLEATLGMQLANVPLVLSGMASSSIGMKELPYTKLPFSLDGADLIVESISATESFQRNTIIVSGVRSADDVMRGEEIQLVGCLSHEQMPEQLFILPGTHSKHITTENGKATALKTYMTGELFNLLSTKSILAASVEKGGSFEEKNNQRSFENGVADSVVYNPLHAFFLVRTNQLFQKMSPEENYFYLSGLLIGTELKELTVEKSLAVTLVSNKDLEVLYLSALQQLGYKENLRTVSVDEAIVEGHYQIYLRCSAK